MIDRILVFIGFICRLGFKDGLIGMDGVSILGRRRVEDKYGGRYS